MGWFLTRKKRKTRRRGRSRQSTAADPKPWNPQRTLAGLKALTAIGLTLALVLGWYYGENALRVYAGLTQSDPISLGDVDLADAPPWMSDAVKQELAGVVADHVASNPLDGDGLEAAAAALRHNPWVAHVQQVRRLAHGRVEVRATYRQPFAIIEARDGYHLVDAHGVRLPGLYFRDQVGRLNMPLISGVDTAPPGRPGQVWPGDQLPAALSLIALLENEAFANQIQAYDVSERDSRGRVRIALLTQRGMVRWGLPPGREHSVETDASVKVRRLREVAASRGSIDAGGLIVDIYGPSIQTLQPAMRPGQAVQSGYSW